MKKLVVGAVALATVAVLAGCATAEKSTSSTDSDGTTTTRSTPKPVNNNWETEFRAAVHADVRDPSSELWAAATPKEACEGVQLLEWDAQDFQDMANGFGGYTGEVLTNEEIEAEAEAFGYYGGIPNSVTFDDLSLIMSEEVIAYCDTIT